MVFGPFGSRATAPPSPPPASMDLDHPPVLPPLDFENPQQDDQGQQQQWKSPEWHNPYPPSPPATIKPEEPNNLDLAAMFEQRCRSWLEAINNQDYGPESVIWQDKTPNWRSRRACNYMPNQTESMDIYEFVESTKQSAQYMPTAHLHILDCTTNLYKNDNGKIEFAETFLNVEVTGAPPGITRRSVAVYNWRLIGGRWLNTTHKSLPGMVVMGPDCMY